MLMVVMPWIHLEASAILDSWPPHWTIRASKEGQAGATSTVHLWMVSFVRLYTIRIIRIYVDILYALYTNTT